MKPSSPPTVIHIWEEFFPGQFIEPHRHLIGDNDFDSRVLAARGINTETTSMPNITCYSRRTLQEWRNRSRMGGLWDRATRKALWWQFNSFCLREASKFAPRLLHAHFGTTAVNLLPVLDELRIPSLVTFYGSDASSKLINSRWAGGYRRMFERFDRFIVLCEGVKERLVAAGCPNEKIRIWNLPAGVESYPLQKREHRGPPRFLIAARFVEKKGYPFLLDAFKRLHDSGKQATLTIIGYGSGYSTLTARVKAMGLNHCVTIIDSEARRDFPSLYLKALQEHDIFVLPSTTAANGDDEGGPALTMICAQASGLPVICTPFVGSELSLIDGETGLYCKQDDSDSLHERMNFLMARPDLWKKFGGAGSALAFDQFSVSKQMKRLKAIYRELL